jgi:glycosyltransferase involved in cell wall biosynthesis
MISVIVPIYKVENYLPACLDSILNSTYKDIEVILVDDGSPDGCGAICDRYAEKDSRVRVIHQPNQGVSAARNAGLDAAKGEYIAFVDSDDVIHPQMMETLLNLINSGNYDFSMVHCIMVQDKGIGYNYVNDATTNDHSNPIIITQEEYIQHLADMGVGSYQYHVVCNKLYKMDLVKGLKFKKMPFEDVEWLNRLSLRLTRGILVESEMYYYIQRAESTMHTNSKTRDLARINCYYTCLNEIPVELPTSRSTMLKALYSVIFMSRHMVRGTELARQVEDQASKVYRETKRELLHSSLSWARKLRILILYNFPSLYSLLLKLRYGLFG